MSKNETARPKVILDGKQAEQELENLTAKAKKYRDAMLEAASVGDKEKEKRLQQQLRATNTELRNLKKEAFDVDRVLKNINGASLNELSQAVRKATNDLKKMQQTDPGYAAQQQKVVALKTKLAELNNEQKVNAPWWSRMADGANRYFSIITAGAASLAGFILGMKQVVQSFNDYEERVDNLSALTGLAGDDLDWLSQKAKDLSTATLEGGIRVKQSAQEIVDAFTKTGSARPELLKNKEALAETTQEAIILANAAKTDLQPAIEALTMVMNQYNVPASEARRIINVLAAGSKEGAGEIPYLTTAFEKAGAVAALANISIESLGAAIETLAPRITQPEIAGRSLKGVLIDMQNGADDTNPAIVGLSTALENLGKKNLSVTELVKKFGTENIATVQILLSNIGEMKKYESAMTGTNVAIEQAAINTDNNNAKLAQAKNRINVTAIALGEKLAPSMTLVTGWFGKALAVLSYLVDVFTKYSRVIITSTAAIVAYTAATKLAGLWQDYLTKQKAKSVIIGEVEYSLTLRSIIARKLETLAINAQIAVTQLWAAAQMLLAGNIKGATQAMRVFSAVTKLNPIGFITGLIFAAGTALYFFARKTNEVSAAQKALNDVNLEAQKNIVDEKLKLEILFNTAKNDKLSKTERLDAIKKLNELSPTYLGNLTLETISSQRAADAVTNYTNALFKMAQSQAAIEKIKEIDKQLLELKTNGADITVWQAFWHGFIKGETTTADRQKVISENTKKQTDDLISQRKKLFTLTTKQAEQDQQNADASDAYSEAQTGKMYKFMSGLKTVGDLIDKNSSKYVSPDDNAGKPKTLVEDPKPAQDLIKLKEKELQDINEEIAATPALVAARNKRAEAKQKEIDALKEAGTSKEGDSGKKLSDEAIKKRVELAEAENNLQMAAIKKRHLLGKTTEDQYNGELLMQEMKFLNDKTKIYKAGSKEYEEAQMQLLEKQVIAEKTVKDLLLKAQNELAGAKIDNLKDGISKQKAVEDQRWKEELTGLKKQMIEKENLSADEIALNDTINKTIEEKAKAHQKALADIDKAEEIRKKQRLIEKFGGVDKYDTSLPFLSLDTLQEYFDNRKSLLEQQYEFEKKAAGDNAQLVTQIEEKYADKRKQLSETETQAVFDMTSRKIEIGQAYLGALAQIFGQESALGKAFFLFSQALAIADVWVKTAAANATIYATALAESAVLGPLAPAAAAALAAPAIAANNTMAALQTGLIAAQTVANFVKGYASGGYTNGDRIYRAGEEGTEFIASNKAVQNPTVKPVLDIIKLAQENGTIRQLNLPAVLAATGSMSSMQQSRSSTGASTASPTQVVVSSQPDPELKQILRDATDAINEWRKYKPSISIEKLDKAWAEYDKVVKGGLK